MTEPATQSLAGECAAAYDDIYASWHAERVTIDWFERCMFSFLDSPNREEGCINGNEIECALKLLGTGDLHGRRILDYCCGIGRTAIYFALRGAEVCAFDASAQAIDIARESAKLSGVEGKIEFAAMDAQDLEYETNSFDAVFCQSALHIIIDYARCASELERVLKPGGRVVFCEEALGHNILLKPIRWMRRLKYRSCGGRALTHDDIQSFGRGFSETNMHYFNLFSQVKSLFGESARHRLIKPALRSLDALDQQVLKLMPSMKRFCGKVVVEYVAGSEPHA